MRTFSAWVIVVLLGIGVMARIYWAINGEPARPATGFGGVTSSLLVGLALASLYYNLGVFSALVSP